MKTRNEQGSITLFTLIAMMFFLTIALTAYTVSSIKTQGQNADLQKIKSNYKIDMSAEGLATLYENLTQPKSKESRYTSIDAVYCNSPDLTGFNMLNTFYVSYDKNGKEKISDLCIGQSDPPNNWYSYKEKRWANVVTINNGNVTYWVWIPKFKYKTPTEDPTLPAKTTDVKFVGEDEDGNEICYDVVNGKKNLVDLSTYKSSNAFEFNGQPLKGYWVSKYRVQEGESNSSDLSLANIEVDVSGFNPNVTRYVTYDDSGTEHIGAKIQVDESGNAKNEPQDWYDYKNKKWANIVTENNGNKTYWTYIPRYEYMVWKYLMPEIRFLKSTDETHAGFKISNAFQFNGQQLKGYWVSKYRVQDGNQIDADESIANIEVDVSGFNPSVTKFVTYDDSGKESEGDNIQISANGTAQNMPQDWYDYKNKKWANIVTENNGLKTYWTYIPRFQYSTKWYYLAPEVYFIKTSDAIKPGFTISKAFEFFGKQLKGYWVSKYRIQDNTDNTEFDGIYYPKTN